MEPTRDEIRAWLSAVLGQTGETATSLARKAGVAPSTLTRFINDPAAPMIGMRSLAKVAAVAGVEPIGLPGRTATAGQPSTSGLKEGEAAPYQSCPQKTALDRAVEALIDGRNAVVPWVLTGTALAAAGYLPGDILIVSLNTAPKAHDIVCAQIYGDTDTAETVFRVYEPPYLVAASLDVTAAKKLRRPLIVDGDRVLVMGVVEASLRPR